MGGSEYTFPVALTWDQGPQKLKRLKNKLHTYFQSKNKSDGGECEIRDTDCSRGYILIHFREEAARDRILHKRAHELKLPDGETLHLEVRSPEDPQTTQTSIPARHEDAICEAEKSRNLAGKPAPGRGELSPGRLSSLVLMENLKDTHTSEILNLLVENISGKSMDSDFFIERIPEIQCAVITFTCPRDTADFIGKFSSNQTAKKQKITARTLEDTKTVRVEGIPPKTPEDMVALYFENPKNGGGSVEDTVMLSDENAALVTFQEAEVLKTVMTRQHVLINKSLRVYPYYPSIGYCLYGKEGPHIAPPDSVQVPICPHILAFILKDAERKRNAETTMAEVSCDITWPNLHHPTPVIKLSFPTTLSCHLRTLAKISPTWNNNVHKLFELFLSKYKVIECDVKPPVWEAIQGKISSSPYEGALIRPEAATEKVYIVGISEDVMKIEPQFKKLVEETTRQVMRVEDEVPLALAAYKLMLAHGLEKSLLEDSPHVKISYDGTSQTIKLQGPKDEVPTAKCEILNTLQGLKSKSIPVNAHIMPFLRSADNEELSGCLFRTNNIKAVFQVDDNAVMLTGYSEKDLKNAEQTLIKELVCKQISVEDKRVTQTPEWRNLKSNLKEIFNGDGIKVTIEEFPMKDGNEVVIAGLSSCTEETYQQIHDFVEKNTVVKRDIKLKSMAVLQFIEEEKNREWKSILQNVKVTKKQNFISLSGPKLYVEEAETRLGQMISDLHSYTYYSDKPGVKKFFTENENMYVTTVRNTHKCVIQLQKEADETISNLGEPCCNVNLQNGATLSIYKGDLCQQNADVIIIASNKNLKPSGAPALAVVEAAGPVLKKECQYIVRKKGELTPGECEITDAGNLPCKKVIHTIVPKWDNNSKYERLLRKSITLSLKVAAQNGQSSIGLSVGDFASSGCPSNLCVENIVKSIKLYTESQDGANTIKNIHLMEKDDDILKTIKEFLNEEFEEKNVQVTPKPGEKKQKKKKIQKKGEMTNKANDQMVTTKEGMIINIKQGNIEDATTNVVVNSVGMDLELNSGAVSRALLKRAGKNLQEVLNKEKQGREVVDGSTFITEGCNLSCDTVIHAVVPEWDNANGSSEKILRKIVADCLSATESKQYRSITIPAMGTGILGYPRNTVAAIMFEEILGFSSRNQPQYVKQVNLVLHPSDAHTIKAFTSELEKRISTGEQKKEDKPRPLCGNVTSPAQDVHEMKVGPVTYQVKIGDITKETCDIIINSTNNTFNLKAGVSKAILDGAGPVIMSECARLGTQSNNGWFAVTGGGNLPCKNIIHVFGQNQAQLIKQSVTYALRECERQQATSVAFPAMGTGAGRVPAADVADAILDAVVDFVKSKSAVTVQNVKVVVFQQIMLNDFHASMKKREPTAAVKQKSFFSWFSSLFSIGQSDKNNDSKEEQEEEEEEPKVFVLKENIEPAIFHLCAASSASMKRALDWLQDLITKDQHDNTIADSWIQDFADQDHEILAELQKKYEVCITFDSPQSTIRVTGRTKDVLEVSNKIQEMIKSVRDKKTREREAELCSNVVEWGYYRGTNFVPFDKMTNLDLENGYIARGSVNISINGVKHTVITERKMARDATGNTIQLNRNSKNEGSLEIPPYWDAMDNTQLKVVPLNNDSQDYSEVVDLFKQTCQMRIIKIERIQNKHLYQNYQIKKNSINTKNGTRTNETRLFHGTQSGAKENINLNGFNRAYAGTNATLLGRGTYFAVEANYSADDTYSKPDPNGHKYMYLARVLTGVYCAGDNSMITPPAKNPSNPTDLYDSVTDSVSSPTVFVIFNDVQAYPEYLITFTM